MKRFLPALLGALILTAAAAQTPASYDDIKQAFTDISTALDVLGQDVDQAQNATDTANAFLKFGAAVKVFKQAMTDLQAKHPELSGNTEPPEELKQAVADMQASFTKLPAILKKAEPYATDPAVQDAIDQMKSGG